METTIQKSLRILVLEDNLYYNKMLTMLINQRLEKLTKGIKLDYAVESYLHFSDFLVNFKKRIDVAFIDFYLDHDKTGLDVLFEIKKNNVDCKIIILSSSENLEKMDKCLQAGASGIIFKDKNTQSLCDFVLAEQVNKLNYGF